MTQNTLTPCNVSRVVVCYARIKLIAINVYKLIFINAIALTSFTALPGKGVYTAVLG